MRAISPHELRQAVLEHLALGPGVDRLDAPEALAALLRRAAAFNAPCPPRTLRRAVLDPLRGVLDLLDQPDGERQLNQQLDELIDTLVAIGDFAERREEDPESGLPGPVLIDVERPAFAALGSYVLLFGVAPDDAPFVPYGIPRERVEHRGHLRRVPLTAIDNLPRRCEQHGLVKRTPEDVFGAPVPESAQEHVDIHDQLLDERGGAVGVDLEELLVLDGTANVMKYRDRWKPLSQLRGQVRYTRVIARRRQAYGAAAWSYVQLNDGRPTRLVDLSEEGNFRACDRAWRLQAALDAVVGSPQRYRVLPVSGGSAIGLYAPPPGWLQRRWDLGRVAEPAPRTVPGALFAYSLDRSAVDTECQFLEKQLWLQRDA